MTKVFCIVIVYNVRVVVYPESESNAVLIYPTYLRNVDCKTVDLSKLYF